MSAPAASTDRPLGTVLVTGAGGRLGRQVVARLVTSPGVQLVATTRGGGSVGGVPTVALDLSDHRAVEDLVATVRPDTVLHLAGIMGTAAESNPLAAIAVNVGSTRAILTATDVLPGSRVVLASTAAVYGDTGEAPADESTPLAGSSVYARTKADAEAALREARTTSVVLRIVNVYGPGFDDSLVMRLLRSSASSPVDLRAPDRFVRDYIHVDDVVDAFLAAATGELPTSPMVANIGTGRPVSSRELVEIVARHRRPVAFESVGAETRSVVSVDIARTVLGFAPRCLERGIASLV